MKILHLSDLHLGKKVNEFSMIKEQKDILEKIIDIIKTEEIDTVLIAGDIYDKAVPTLEAIELFDDFLYDISEFLLKILIITGNHDSAERMAFADRFLERSGIYIVSSIEDCLNAVTLKDDIGDVNVYMIPFLKPIYVKAQFPEEEINSYNDALKVVVKNMKIDNTKRNILMSHQFVTGAITSDSEQLSLGGLDNIDANLFFDFDYVALGHIHRPQKMLKDTIRYCGAPLKYSLSEINHKKSVTVVQFLEKDNVTFKQIELTPLHDIKHIKGSYDEITEKSYYENLNLNDYFYITLIDEIEIVGAISKLRNIYPKIMKLDYDNKRTRKNNEISVVDNLSGKSTLTLFLEFYEMQNGKSLNETQLDIINSIIEECE